MLQETQTLPDGLVIPKPGLGTWMICDDKAAVAPGYRHIDTSQAYGIERGVGIFIRDCGVPREELCVQTGLGAEVKDHHGANAGPRGRAPRDSNTCSDRQDRPCG